MHANMYANVQQYYVCASLLKYYVKTFILPYILYIP